MLRFIPQIPWRFDYLVGSTMLLAVAVVFVTGCYKPGTGSTGGENSQEDLLKGIVTSKPPETPESLAAKQAKLKSNLVAAKEAVAQGNLDQAITLLKECMTLDAWNREVLMMLVERVRDRSREVVKEDPARSYLLMVEAGGYLQMLRDAHQDFSHAEQAMFASVLFDEACAHARSKRREEFSGAFQAAIAAGFDDIQRIKTDPDLEEFRQVPELKNLMDEAIELIASPSPPAPL